MKRAVKREEKKEGRSFEEEPLGITINRLNGTNERTNRKKERKKKRKKKKEYSQEKNTYKNYSLRITRMPPIPRLFFGAPSSRDQKPPEFCR